MVLILYRISVIISRQIIRKGGIFIRLYDRYSEIRDRKGLNDFQVSRETGVPQASIYDWKYGRSTPKVDKLKKIADFLEVSLDELVG